MKTPLVSNFINLDLQSLEKAKLCRSLGVVGGGALESKVAEDVIDIYVQIMVHCAFNAEMYFFGIIWRSWCFLSFFFFTLSHLECRCLSTVRQAVGYWHSVESNTSQLAGRWHRSAWCDQFLLCFLFSHQQLWMSFLHRVQLPELWTAGFRILQLI